MPKALKTNTTDALHPARLLVSQLSPADFSKKFRPSISNTPPLLVIEWTAGIARCLAG